MSVEREDIGWQHHVDDTDGNPEFYEGRALWQNDLNQVTRFKGVQTYNKSSLLDHVTRLDFLQVSLSSKLRFLTGIEIDGLKTKRFAEHHDDAEVITGDIPSPIKAAWTDEERLKFTHKENEAMQILARRYMPEKYVPLYLSDWKEVSEKQSAEAQIVDIADKWDGLCEVLTEIRCGNDSSEIFKVLENYQGIFKRLSKHPLMNTLLDHRALGFDHIPTVEEAKGMSKIDINVIDQPNGIDEFWKRVFDPNVPYVYEIIQSAK